MEIKVGWDIKIPTTPNYLLTTDGRTIPLKHISEESLREIGRLWTEEHIKKGKG